MRESILRPCKSSTLHWAVLWAVRKPLPKAWLGPKICDTETRKSPSCYISFKPSFLQRKISSSNFFLISVNFEKHKTKGSKTEESTNSLGKVNSKHVLFVTVNLCLLMFLSQLSPTNERILCNFCPHFHVMLETSDVFPVSNRAHVKGLLFII